MVAATKLPSAGQCIAMFDNADIPFCYSTTKVLTALRDLDYVTGPQLVLIVAGVVPYSTMCTSGPAAWNKFVMRQVKALVDNPTVIAEAQAALNELSIIPAVTLTMTTGASRPRKVMRRLSATTSLVQWGQRIRAIAWIATAVLAAMGLLMLVNGRTSDAIAYAVTALLTFYTGLDAHRITLFLLATWTTTHNH